MVQLSHLYMTTGKTVALTIWTFVGKVLSLLFNTMSATATAAAAKALQSCPTLCDPWDGSPPDFTIPGILQARTLEWVAISFSNAGKWKVKGKSLSCVRLFSDPMDCSLPGSSVRRIFQARVLEWGAIALGLSKLFFHGASSFNFMAAVNVCSDFGAQENKVCHYFHFFPIYLPWSNGTRCHDLSFLNVEFYPAFSLSSFTFIKRLFSSSLLSVIRVVSSAYLRLLIFLPAVLIPVCAPANPALLMMYSAH